MRLPASIVPSSRMTWLPRPAPALGQPLRVPIASVARTPLQTPSTASPARLLHTSRPRFARYERFGGPTTPGPGGGPDIYGYLRRRLGGDRAIWIYGVGGGGAVIYYVYHLERVPETGRLRFMDCSEAKENELGLQTQLQTLQQYSRAVLPPNHPTTQRVRKIATRIIESSGLGRVKAGGEMGAVEAAVNWGNGSEPNIGDIFFGGASEQRAEQHLAHKQTEWEVYVIDDRETKNAFVLPGGKIFVFTGILPVSANDDGLATVMGHEIAHQVARHSAERLSSVKVLFALGFLLESLGLDVGFTRIALTLLYQLPNSRTNESEADQIGLRLMSKACFDPRESTKMWERMSQSEGRGGGKTDFLSTHPANAKRIQNLEKWMPEALQIRAASPCSGTASHHGDFLDATGQGMGKTFWG